LASFGGSLSFAAEPLWVIRGVPKIFENFDLQIPEKDSEREY